MMDGGFDIAIELDKRYFIDHITLALAGGSETAGIDVIDETGRLIARAPAEATATGKPVTLSPGAFAERLTLRFHAAFTHIGIAAIEIYAAATGRDFAAIEQEFLGCGYGDFKLAVGEAVAAMLAPVQERFAECMKDRAQLETLMKTGAEHAQYVAGRTVQKLKKKMGFVML